MNKIGQNVKKIRIFLEMTQSQFASAINITQGALSKIERGDIKQIDPEILARISHNLNISLDWLIMDKGSPPDKDSVARSIKETLSSQFDKVSSL